MLLPQGGEMQCTAPMRQSITVSLPASEARIADWSMTPVTEHLSTSKLYCVPSEIRGCDREGALLFDQ